MTLYDKVTLKNINLEIKKGEFVAVVGEIGSGKSSLISSIIGYMLHIDKDIVRLYDNHQKSSYNISNYGSNASLNSKDIISPSDSNFVDKLNVLLKESKSEPDMKVTGTISLIEQNPWILNQTIRDNITFGKRLIPEKYNETIEICQLVRDLEILPGGDMTQIGEKGINLSGGQKARVSIARAVYANNDIVLMDDPLSALDAHVKKQIFDRVLCDKLRSKTRVLVTHAIDVLDRVDRIIIVDQGQIIHQGHYDELQNSEYFRKIFESLKHDNKNNEEVKEDPNLKNERPVSKEQSKNETKSYMSKKEAKLTVDENKEKINVDYRMYYKFFTYSNWTLITIAFSILLIILNRFVVMLFSYYMLSWVKDISKNRSSNPVLLRDIIYTTCAITLISCFSGIAQICFNLLIGVNLFKDMLNRICHAPVNTYFDVTPSGLILNRFSKDLQVSENALPNSNKRQITNIVTVLFSFAFAAYNVVWVLIFIPIMVCL